MTELNEHIRQLAKPNITIDHCPDYFEKEEGGCVWYLDPKPLISLSQWPLETTNMYLIALHELGHLMTDQHPESKGCRKITNRNLLPQEVLLNEWLAWEWAKENSINDWTPEAIRFRNEKLLTYAAKDRWESLNIQLT